MFVCLVKKIDDPLLQSAKLNSDSKAIISDLESLGLRFPVPSLSAVHTNSEDSIKRRSEEDKEAFLKSYFSTLDKQQVLRLYEKYKIDFLLFDYNLNPFLSYAGLPRAT